MSNGVIEPEDLPPAERRAEIRVPASTLPDVSTRLVGGNEITLLNYASTSLYAQSPSRLLVGARILVRVATATLNAVVAGRVVRASLTRIVEGVPRYEVAVQLEREVDWASAGHEEDRLERPRLATREPAAEVTVPSRYPLDTR